jgi:ribosomal protein S12 methylthiotransferase accessory factor
MAQMSSDLTLVEARLRGMLAQMPGALVTRVHVGLTEYGELPLMIASAAAKGSSRMPFNGISVYRPGTAISGGGAGLTSEAAVVPALAEVVERHATSTYYDEQFVWASAKDLDSSALDLDTVARCSDVERANPHCSLGLPTKSDPIRWVTGIDLHDGSPALIPAVMVYSHTGWKGPQERFWLSISTGCAAHRTYDEALLTAISEAVERDAIAIIWRQQLNLPEIVVDDPGEELSVYWDMYQHGNADVKYRFFDATLDVGIPTVYGLQISKHHPTAHTTVACATASSYEEAICKVIKDFVAFKRVFTRPRVFAEDIKSFKGLLDGATYMAVTERAHAFNFLLNTEKRVTLSSIRNGSGRPTSLPEVLRRLASLGMRTLAVDLTTDEAFRVGLKVVRVVIPALQPFSLHSSAQYLAHPRLYSAPVAMGYASKDELHLNPWPQPFA